MHQEEEKYPEIRNKLLSLPRIKASEDFMTKLQHKINLAEAEERNAKLNTRPAEEKKKFFGFSGWLVPSLSFGAVAVIAFLVIYTGVFRTSKDDISNNNNVASSQEKMNSDITGNEDKLPGTRVPDQIIAGDLKQDKSDLSAPPVSPETKFSTDRMTAEPPKVMKMLTPNPSTSEPVNEKEKIIETQKRTDDVIEKEEKTGQPKDVMKKSDESIKDEKKVSPIPGFPKGEDKKSEKEGGKIDNLISPFVNPSDKPAKIIEDEKKGQEKNKDNKENKQENNIKQQKDTTTNKKKEKQKEIIKETPKQDIPRTETPKIIIPKEENKNQNRNKQETPKKETPKQEVPKQETKNKQEQNKNND